MKSSPCVVRRCRRRTLFSTHIIQTNSLFTFTLRVRVRVCVRVFVSYQHKAPYYFCVCRMPSEILNSTSCRIYIFSNFERTHWPSNLDKRASSTTFPFAVAKTQKPGMGWGAYTHTRGAVSAVNEQKLCGESGMCRSIVCLKHSKMVRMVRPKHACSVREVTRDWCDGCARSGKFKYGAVGWTDPLMLEYGRVYI